MILLHVMKKDIEIYKDNFCLAVKRWFDEYYKNNKRGAVTHCAKKFGIKQSHMSQILGGTRWIGEEVERRRIADLIGMDYEEMIGVKQARNGYVCQESQEDKITDAHGDESSISKLNHYLVKARVVLESQTHYADSLSNNIDSFYKGVAAERSVAAMERRIGDDPDKIPGGSNRRKSAVK